MKWIVKIIRSVLEHSLLNPGSWTGVAVVLIAAWALVHLLGWRVDTAVISGTVDVTRGTPQQVMMQGTAYALAYFGAVVVSPILLLASGLFLMLDHLTRARQVQRKSGTVSAGERIVAQ